jgi:2-aminoethylphosphonate-pyruvate transaminase
VDDALILLNPGPAGTSQRVKDALTRGDLCHREPEFGELLAGLRADLARALNLPDHEALLITGSGTSAMEMAVISSVRADRAVLVVNNGVYGERLLKIAKANGITAYEVKPDGDDLTRWTTPIDPAAVAEALRGHPDVDAVACVHHETTTGLINPVREIGALVAETDALFVIDAISATGNEDQDLAEVRADIVCGTANKGLHGQPGISFILCSPKGVSRLEEVPARSLYLNAADLPPGAAQGRCALHPGGSGLLRARRGAAGVLRAGRLRGPDQALPRARSPGTGRLRPPGARDPGRTGPSIQFGDDDSPSGRRVV